MTIRNLIPFLALILLSQSCGKGENSYSTIEPVFSKDPLKVVDIAETLEILEVKTESPIGPNPILLANERFIYLFDQDYTNNLFQLSRAGQVLKLIEFGIDNDLSILGITNIFLDDDKIGVVSRGEKINWFDDNLQLLGNEPAKLKGKFISPFDNGFAVFNNHINDSEPWEFMYYSDLQTIKDLPIDPDDYDFVYQTSAPFSRWNNDLVFVKMFNDTIYSFDTSDRLNRLFSINFGSYSVPTDLMKKISNPFDMMNFFNERKNRYLLGSVFNLADEKLLFNVNDRGNQKIGIWSREDNSFKIYPFIADTSKSGINLYSPSLSEGNRLYFGLSGEQLSKNEGIMMKPFEDQLSSEYMSSYFIFILGLK